MEVVPEMPAVPPAGQPVSGELVYAAMEAANKRSHLSDNRSPAAKRRRVEDAVRVFNIQAAAGGYQGLQQQQQVLELLQGLQQTLADVQQTLQQQGQALQQQGQALQQQGQALQQQGQTLQQLLAWQANVRLRAHNLRVNIPGSRLRLQPLCREAAADGAVAGGAEPGNLPAQGVFPDDWQALHNLRTQDLDALEEFYGQLFAGATVAARREAFAEFVTQ